MIRKFVIMPIVWVTVNLFRITAICVYWIAAFLWYWLLKPFLNMGKPKDGPR